MTCSNCGANITPDLEICPNCGVPVGDAYVLRTSEYEARDYRYKPEPKKKNTGKNIVRAIIVFVLTLALVGGSYYYFEYQHTNKDAPSLTFSSGTGIVNDEKVVYIIIDDSSNIEYIHGVNIYEGDITKSSLDKPDPISSDYSYTKNVSDGFRAIFFNADELNINPDSSYTYTFEMTFGFAKDTNFYTYQRVVSFKGDITQDATEIVFDHSMKEELPQANPNQNSDTDAEEEIAEPINIDFAYKDYWFTEPIKVDDNYSISCWKINKDGTIDVTSYNKAGNEEFKLSYSTISYELNGQYMTITDSSAYEKMYIKLDPDNNSIVEVDDELKNELSALTQRVYNSVSNAEDFFGI